MKGVCSFEISGKVTRHMNFFRYQKLLGKWKKDTTCRSLMCALIFILQVCVCVQGREKEGEEKLKTQS